MSKTVYLKLNQITEIHRKDVALKDVAEVYCEDKNIQNKCSAMKVKHITGDRKHRYVMSALEVIEKLEQLDSAIQVNNVGEVDFIIAYQPATSPHVRLAVGQDAVRLRCLLLRRGLCHHDLQQ